MSFFLIPYQFFLLNRKVQMDFSEPWGFAALRKAQSGPAEGAKHRGNLSPKFDLS